MFRNNLVHLAEAIFILALLAGCGGGKSERAAVVEAYLQALVEKDGARLAALACADWEEDAAMELDSFQAVEAVLQELSCEESGTDGDTGLVRCTGQILATYNNEQQVVDLSLRTYRLVREAGEERVCGYQ